MLTSWVLKMSSSTKLITHQSSPRIWATYCFQRSSLMLCLCAEATFKAEVVLDSWHHNRKRCRGNRKLAEMSKAARGMGRMQRRHLRIIQSPRVCQTGVRTSLHTGKFWPRAPRCSRLCCMALSLKVHGEKYAFPTFLQKQWKCYYSSYTPAKSSLILRAS